MFKKKWLIILSILCISSNIMNGSGPLNYSSPQEPHCCYTNPDSNASCICFRCGNCRCKGADCFTITCSVALIGAIIGVCIGVGLSDRDSGSSPSNGTSNSNTTLSHSSFYPVAAPQHSIKPATPEMEERDSSFTRLISTSNATHIASLLKRNNKKKQS